MRALEILGEQVEIFHRGAHLSVPEDDREPHHVPPCRKYWVAKVWRRRWKPLCGSPRFFNRQ
jgi:hypothetical protein